MGLGTQKPPLELKLYFAVLVLTSDLQSDLPWSQKCRKNPKVEFGGGGVQNE
jgi:hypothetical protein